MNTIQKLCKNLKDNDYIVFENSDHKPFNKDHTIIENIEDKSTIHKKQFIKKVIKQKLTNKKI